MSKKTPDDTSKDKKTLQDSHQKPKNQDNTKNNSTNNSKTSDSKTHIKAPQRDAGRNSILDEMDEQVQYSLLMGIQDSLEALFSMGESSSQSGYQKGAFADKKMRVDMEVVEGGLSEHHTDESEKILEQDDGVINRKPRNLKHTPDKPSFELIKDAIEEQDVPNFGADKNSDTEYDEKYEGKKNADNWDIKTQFQRHLEQFFEGSDVEFQVYSSDEFFDISEMSDVLKQFHNVSQNTEKDPPKKKSPNFEVYSFEDKKEQKQKQQKQKEQKEQQNSGAIIEKNAQDFVKFEHVDQTRQDTTESKWMVPDGRISLVVGSSQKIYVGTQHRIYRIFCEEGILLVKFCTHPEYRDVTNESYLIEEEVATLFSGQSIDVAFNHIEIQAIQKPKGNTTKSQENLDIEIRNKNFIAKGRYFLIQEPEIIVKK